MLSEKNKTPSLVLRQLVSSSETRAVVQACMLLDIQVRPCAQNRFSEHAQELAKGQVLPVGDVGYVQGAMRATGIEPPQSLSYPSPLHGYLHRRVWQAPIGDALEIAKNQGGAVFVKPFAVKQFTGFVYRPSLELSKLRPADLEQTEILHQLVESVPHELAWFSEPVKFVSEHRYYVCNGAIWGHARYDTEEAEDAPAPDYLTVEKAAAAWQQEGAPASYALDFGVLSDGKTALVEANDAWAIGLYANALSPVRYLHFLAARWNELKGANTANS